jgi:hypothetical protein
MSIGLSGSRADSEKICNSIEFPGKKSSPNTLKITKLIKKSHFCWGTVVLC